MGVWKAYWIGVVALGAVVPASAQWQLIDDFQQWERNDIFYDANQIGWNASALEQTDEYWMLQDPIDSDNIAVYVESGNYGVGYGNTFVMKALPFGGIPPNETGTLFFRSFWPGYDNYWHMGTADRPLAFDSVTGLQTAPGAWSDFNALIRHGYGLREPFEHRDGGGYIPTNPPVTPLVNEWYCFWMVMENTWDMSTTPPTCTGSYTLYIQGEGIGDGSSPTLIPVGTDPPKDSASFRRAPADENGNPQAIIWAVFATNSGAPPSPSSWDIFYLDDFFFSRGKNLSSPLTPGGGWAGYWISNTSGDVDTGDFLGWINVTKSPYIWSYALNNWIYMEEPAADAPGAWACFFK